MRYADHLPLPPYTYVPGRTPHPLSDPQGHGFRGVTFDEGNIDLAHWDACAAYCYGVDLFNDGFYWEAHEVWEGLWQRAGRRGPIADFLKGLIKMAAALVKAHEGRTPGVQRHAARAAQLFRTLQKPSPVARPNDIWGGLRLSDLCTLCERMAARAADLASGEIALPFASCKLTPQVTRDD